MHGQFMDCNSVRSLQPFQINRAFPNQPMNIIMTLAMNSAPNEKANSETVFPLALEIDYIRYYQKKPCVNMIITQDFIDEFEDGNLNTIIGKKVTVEDNLTFPEFLNLNIVATQGFEYLGSEYNNFSRLNFIENPMACEENAYQGKFSLITDNECYSNKPNLDVLPTFNLYPNPSNGIFTLSSLEFRLQPTQLEFNIYNRFGQLVHSENTMFIGAFEFNLPNLINGLYIMDIRLYSGQSIGASKISIMR